MENLKKYTFEFLQKEAKKKKSKIFCNDNLIEPFPNYSKHKYFIDNNIEFYIVDDDDNEPHIIIKKNTNIEKIYFNKKFPTIEFLSDTDILNIKKELSDIRATELFMIVWNERYNSIKKLILKEDIQ